MLEINMKRYIKVYLTLLQLNMSVLLTYRANFINSAVSSIGWGTLTYVSIILLTSRVSSVYGWTRNDMIMLTAGYNIVIGAFHLLFSRNFERFSTVINRGLLDSILIKPIDSQFLLSFWIVNYTSAFRVCVGVLVMLYMLFLSHIPLTLGGIIGFILFMVLGVIILYSTWFMFSTIIIWHTTLSNIVGMLYQINTVAAYPQEFYRGVNSYLSVIVLPLALIVAVPVKAMTHKITMIESLQIITLGIIFLFISRRFWKFALRFYTSASG